MKNNRYFRKTIAYPEGSTVHDGDCEVFNIDICTCGLLHWLRPKLDDGANIYLKMWDELAKHDTAIDKIRKKI